MSEKSFFSTFLTFSQKLHWQTIFYKNLEGISISPSKAQRLFEG